MRPQSHRKPCLVAQSCPTLCDPMDHSPLGSSIHGILQARTLEWVAISFSRASSQPRNRTWVSHMAGELFTVQAAREAHRIGVFLVEEVQSVFQHEGERPCEDTRRRWPSENREERGHQKPRPPPPRPPSGTSSLQD